MAYTKLSEKKVIATNLTSFISSNMELLKKERDQVYLENESKFVRSVLEDNLTLEQQLAYRQDQVKNIEDKVERRRVRDAIATLRDQIEQKKYQDEYIDQLGKMNEGSSSIDSTIKWLEKRLRSTTDPTIATSIKNSINTMKFQRYTIQKQALESGTTYAKESQLASTIEKQITKVNDARAAALLAGNDDYVGVLDLQLQSLNKSLSEAKATDKLLSISNSTLIGNSALATLNTINKYISEADENAPINIGGVRYASEKAYWDGKRTEYLNDRSNNGFFARYNSELVGQVSYKSSKGILNNDSLGDVKSWYTYIQDRPELADFKERITQEQQSALQMTADNLATKILNEYSTKLDAKKAVTDLAHIQDAYGVDMTVYYQKVISGAAKEKEDQVRQLIGSMEQLMANNPGMTQQEALDQAAKSGAAAIISPEELANKSATDIISDLPGKSSEQLNDNSSTVNDEAAAFSSPSYQEGGLYKTANSNTVYKYEGGKLRTLTGNWDEDQLKAATGKGFKDVQIVKNISGAPTGEVLTPQVVNTNPITSQPRTGAKVTDPDLLKYYKPEEIITQGTDKFLRSDVKQVWGEKLTPTKFTQMQKQYDPTTLESKVIRANGNIYLKQS